MLDVPATPLDLPLLLGGSGGCRVDLEAVVACQLPVGAVEHRLAVGAEGRTDHGGLQVVRDEDLRDAAEELERLGVELGPGPRLLVEDQGGVHVAAEPEGHHEQPGPEEGAAAGVVASPGVDEVDLGDLPGGRLHGDGDVGVAGAPLALEAQAQALDRREGPPVVGLVRDQPVVDGGRPGPLLLPQPPDVFLPRLDRGGDLGHLDRGQVRPGRRPGAPRGPAGPRGGPRAGRPPQGPQVGADGVPAHPEPVGDRSGAPS